MEKHLIIQSKNTERNLGILCTSIVSLSTFCCAEPVITEGLADIRVLNDGWTAVSLDDSRSAQFEHTVLITRHGVEILTL